MKKLNKPQKINYLAIELLERLGNRSPSQRQINLMEVLVSKIVIEQKLSNIYQRGKHHANYLSSL